MRCCPDTRTVKAYKLHITCVYAYKLYITCVVVFRSRKVGITGSVSILHIQSKSEIQLPNTEEGDLIDPRTFKVFDEEVDQLHVLFSCRLHHNRRSSTLVPLPLSILHVCMDASRHSISDDTGTGFEDSHV